MARGRALKHFSLSLLLLGASFAVLPSSSGCSKNSKDDLRNCDVPAIFGSSCTGSTCHSGGIAIADLDLESAGVDQRLFHIAGTSNCDERKLVVPGHPEESLLYIKASQDKPFCGATMPPGRKLSDSELACLRHYIEQAGTSTDGNQCETCGGVLCADFDRDPAHCGGCDQACDEGKVCGDGKCINPCSEGETLCGASCVQVASSDNNCGSCGHRCGPGSRCDQGVCICDAGAQGAGGGGGADGGFSAPENVSFKDDILPMFEATCSGSSCHTEEESSAPLGLDAATAYQHLVDVTAEGCDGKKLVVPGSPDTSYLVDKLMGGDVCAGGRMPLSDEPLPNEGIGRVVSWICDGAPDN